VAYASVATLRAHIDKTGNEDDVVLARILDAATISIDRACNRYLRGFAYFQAPAVASARTYAGSGKVWQRIDPCIAVTLVEVKDSATADDYTAWDAADWLAFQGSYERPTFGTLPYTALMASVNGDYYKFTKSLRGPTVRVSARWGGYASPPADIAEACVMQSARWYKREQSAMSDTLATPEMGMLLYQKSLDPDIRRILVDGRHINSVVYGL
jgi:hypothetical protein